MRPVALITGGTRGIGLGIAKKLAAEGVDLALNGVRPESEVQDVLQELRKSGVEVVYFPGNIASKEDRESILQGVKEKFGRLNFLVNNAGVAPRVRADLLEVEEEDFDHLMDINLKGTFFLTQKAATWMKEQKESHAQENLAILTITSVSAKLASTNRAAYCIAKSGLSMMSQVFAVKMAGLGIPVYEIQPGVIETDMTEKVKGAYQERIQNGLTLEQRMGTPEDIGKAVAAILRGDFPYATGQIFTIDGGMMVGRL
ncbi:NAD(P)-dependent dehydrogenase (short-subunit alcohol dehydrogenase family) [Algoriphagus boseongensis]|uniref:NAD(P)-dependent dehydrogenase (Short-subunit alcohol dehydrogenase family) n=1 Tax=Algoriphagus boseongensis TaxID=1442587 RepID=A0A4R6T4Q9_9BACT|nr:3-ketoacyl-ACP reductase [Algoriphagus boseongensis]TDQ13677.1 NAD(P)-dependent dehydrogenase (short-subunit alcohol dehydrogenase family) [Algoriphagus boseongensis]